MRIVICVVVVPAWGASLASVDFGSFGEPDRGDLLVWIGRVLLGELGDARGVGLDPREHLVAGELELLGDGDDGHLPAALGEGALEDLELRGGEVGREGLEVFE